MRKDEFKIGVLEPTEEDFNLFCRARSLCFLDKSKHDPEKSSNLQGIQQAILESGTDYWRELFLSSFCDPPTAYFVLQKKENTGKERPVGMAEICYYHENGNLQAEFRGGHIDSNRMGLSLSQSFRNLGLGKNLWDARIKHVQEMGAAKIRTFILKDNEASWKAAERKKFLLQWEGFDPLYPEDGLLRRYELNL
ncbi:MAG: GNAT family N-acetyltransferase [Alphaproteobacteria bacterium]